jgi:hypothetical protein
VGKSKVSGPGKIGSMKAMKDSLKSKGNPNIRNVPSEDSLTVRFLDEPEDWYGYYEHYVNGSYQPCVSDDCEGCNSNDPNEQRKNFRYLANGYVVDDQKVRAIKMPKSLVEQLVGYYEKKGTIMDRDYELSRTGSGQMDTKYMASPESPVAMKLSRFEKQKFDLADVLDSLIGVADDDDEPEPKKKPKKKKDANPWADEDDEPVKVKKKKSSASTVKKSKTAPKKTVKKKSSGAKPAVKRTVKRK